MSIKLKFRRLPIALISGGILARLLYWWLYPPIYKLHAVFTPLDSSALAYMSNFQGYMAVRMPFFDVFAAAFYVLFEDLLGVKALSAFTVFVCVASLPVFYLVVANLFDERIATFSLLFYSLYPKFIVLSAQGFPEAASVAFLVFSLYAFTNGLPERSSMWLGIAGIFALLAYLMFIPAVAVGVLIAAWIYIDQVASEKGGWNRFVPDLGFVAYASSPGIVGILYLVYGPLAKSTGVVSGSWSNMASSLFSHNYGLVERIVRYVGYVYFDFWWHFRGYDKEDGILRVFTSLQEFLGPIFPIYVMGWFAITLSCSVLVVYGLSSLFRKRNRRSTFVVSWFLMFVLLYTIRNWGWTGVFQTRHVFTVFPAIAIAFGVGAASVLDMIPPLPRVSVKWDISSRTVVFTFLSLCFLVLLVNGAVEGAMVAENHHLSKEQPVDELQSIVKDGETVAVATRWDYYTVVMYSESSIRPTLVAATPSDVALFKNWTVLADLQHVEPDTPTDINADYFYATHCGDWYPRQEQYIESLNRSDATVVHQRVIDRGPGQCTVRTVVYELPDR